MPTKPDGALTLETDLKFKGSSGLPSSGHKVEKVTFLLDGREIRGFFKPCDQETYPPLLAKYEVAFSIDYQVGLGQRRAPLSKLVYNEAGQIVGTVSIALNDFRSLSTGSVSSDPDVARYENPNTELLIKANAARALIAAWRRKEDDGHNGNFGFVSATDPRGEVHQLFASIDRDMSYWPLTSHIKGKRGAESTPMEQVPEAKLGKLNVRDLSSFPKRESKPHFWPTESIALTTSVTKGNPCAAAFSSLSSNDAFKDQVHMALLLELLSFQPLALAQRLEPEVGKEIPLDLKGFAKLGAEQTQKKDELVGRDKTLFFDQHNVERTFVDHIIRFLTKEYSEFYTTVVLNYPTLHEFLRANPKAIDQAIGFFELENQTLNGAAKFDIEQIKQSFQKVWRDSARATLISGESAILASIRVLNKFVKAEEQFTIKTVETNGQDLLVYETVRLEPAKKASSKYHKPLQCLEALYQGYITLTKSYNAKDFVAEEDNRLYVSGCRKLINKQRSQLEDDVAFKQLLQPDKEKILSCFDELTKVVDAVDFEQQEEKRDRDKHKAFGYRASYEATGTNNFFKPLFVPSASNCKEMQTILGDWLCEQRIEDIVSYISTSMEIYKSRTSKAVADTAAKLVGWVSSWGSKAVSASVSSREQAIAEIVKREMDGARAEHNSVSLSVISAIFKEGGWESTSFNTILLKRILPTAVNTIAGKAGSLEKYPNIAQIKDYLTRNDNWVKDIKPIAKDISTTLNRALIEAAPSTTACQ